MANGANSASTSVPKVAQNTGIGVALANLVNFFIPWQDLGGGDDTTVASTALATIIVGLYTAIASYIREA